MGGGGEGKEDMAQCGGGFGGPMALNMFARGRIHVGSKGNDT